MRSGQILDGKYELLQLLGEGGMGQVWSARHRLTGSDCAVKLLLGSLAEHQEALARFQREVKATGRLEHAGIVRVLDAGQLSDARPFVVLERLWGQSLEQRLKDQGILEAPEVCQILADVCRAVAYAHSRGVIHRDLSTANVFLSRQPGERRRAVKLRVFGVAKLEEAEVGARRLTGNGSILGSPEYMSPEQAAGAAQVDRRTDVWAIGVQAYECLTGAAPFQGRNYNAQIMAVVNNKHRPLLAVAPHLDRKLVELVEHCLQKDREKRPASAAELAMRFDEISARLARVTPADQPSWGRRAADQNVAPPVATRVPRARVVPAVLFGTLGLLLAMGLWFGRPTSKTVRSLAGHIAPARESLRPGSDVGAAVFHKRSPAPGEPEVLPDRPEQDADGDPPEPDEAPSPPRRRRQKPAPVAPTKSTPPKQAPGRIVYRAALPRANPY